MSQKGLFKGFSEEEQEKLAQEAEQMYDPATVRESNRKWKLYSKEKKDSILAEGNQIYLDMIAAMPQGAESAEVQKIVERWRSHMDYFWTPNLDQLLGLAEMYNLAEFMREAVAVYVGERMKDKG